VCFVEDDSPIISKYSLFEVFIFIMLLLGIISIFKDNALITDIKLVFSSTKSFVSSNIKDISIEFRSSPSDETRAHAERFKNELEIAKKSFLAYREKYGYFPDILSDANWITTLDMQDAYSKDRFRNITHGRLAISKISNNAKTVHLIGIINGDLMNDAVFRAQIEKIGSVSSDLGFLKFDATSYDRHQKDVYIMLSEAATNTRN
jgi:hypothetical protein